MVIYPLIPIHINQVFSTVSIVEKGGIKARAIQLHWITPGTEDRFTGNKVVVAVLPHTIHNLYISINQPKLAICIA